MKNIFLLLIMVFLTFQNLAAQIDTNAAATDTTRKEKANLKAAITVFDTIKVQLLVKREDTIMVQHIIKRGDTVKISVDTLYKGNSLENLKCLLYYKTLNVVEWLLVFTPFILFLILFFTIGSIKDFVLKDALTENEPPKKTIKNPEYSAGVIAASGNIPNLSILFPPTIEVSNISPTIIELKEIVKSKDAALEEMIKKLEKANSDNTRATLTIAVSTAQADLDNTNTEKSKLMDAVTAAQTVLDSADPQSAQAVADAKTVLEAANKAVLDNEAAIKAATEKLAAANKAVSDNTDTISRLANLTPKVEAELEEAKNNFSIAVEIAKTNTAYSVNTYRPSISRYIAFITSIVIIMLVVCMSSFFIYHYMRTGGPPDFSPLTTMLIALGLGVTPYITNKISTAATANKS